MPDAPSTVEKLATTTLGVMASLASSSLLSPPSSSENSSSATHLSIARRIDAKSFLVSSSSPSTAATDGGRFTSRDGGIDAASSTTHSRSAQNVEPACLLSSHERLQPAAPWLPQRPCKVLALASWVWPNLSGTDQTQPASKTREGQAKQEDPAASKSPWNCRPTNPRSRTRTVRSLEMYAMGLHCRRCRARRRG
eukprot:scaffold107269_cov34-Tisochrysis_lutea.AAC.3